MEVGFVVWWFFVDSACAFLAFALYLGKESFLVEIVRVICYGGSGFCAGFSLNNSKKKDNNEK